MAELTVTCPMCGLEIHGSDEDGVAKNYTQHAHEAHGMDISEEEAKEVVKIWLEE
jgi:predicted small metal-binding protein